MYRLAAPILFRTLYLECEGFPDEPQWYESQKGRVHPIYICIHVRTIIIVRPRLHFWCDGEYDEPIKPNATPHYPAQLRTILRCCQNLETLSLINKGRYRVRRQDMWDGLRRKEEEAGINKTSLVTLEEGDDLPRVQNLRLRGMRFGPLQSESWATQLLWRNIKHLSLLEVNWTSLLPKLTEKGCFHAIEALEASVPIPIPSFTKLHTNTKCISQFHAFLENLPPLKTFIGYGFPQETLAVLAAHHSQHLKDLRFRNQLNTGTGYSTGDPAFRASIHSLENLSTQFPSLDSLGLQVDWTTDEELPYDLIANVVLQTRIRHLELNLPDLSRSRSKSWPYPGANEDTCQALIQSLDEISTSLLSLHIDIGDWYPYRVDRSFRWPLGAFVIGERDYAGRMRFRKIRQFVPSGTLLREGDLVVEVPPWVTKGSWPSGLRQDMEGRISDMFCGKMVREKYANH